MLNQGFMMLYVLSGILGILFAVALFVDVLNASEGNYKRIKKLSVVVTLLIGLAFLIGGAGMSYIMVPTGTSSKRDNGHGRIIISWKLNW